MGWAAALSHAGLETGRLIDASRYRNAHQTGEICLQGGKSDEKIAIGIHVSKCLPPLAAGDARLQREIGRLYPHGKPCGVRAESLLPIKS